MAESEISTQEVEPKEELAFPRGVPSYLVAADNHTLSSGDLSMGDYLKGGVGALGGAAAGAAIGAAFIPIFGGLPGAIIGGVGGAILGAKTLASDGKFAAVSAVSGWSDFYNSGVTLTNWLGVTDHEAKMNTLNKLAEWDSDLSQYYSKNRESADLAGFVAGSLLPAADSLVIYNYGAKALMAAKYGKLGTNFSEATGLLGPTQAKYLDKAISELGSASVYNLTNANVLKAFAAGVGEEAIQGMVTSTAILATMHASPILEGQDAKDIAWNILSGGLFQGVAGGVFRNAKAYGYVKKGVLAAEDDAKPLMFVGELRDNAPPSASIVNWVEERVRIQGEKTEGENATYKERLKEETTRKLYDRTLEKTKELTEGNETHGQGVGNIINSWDDPEEAGNKLVGLTKIAGVKYLTDLEKLVNSAKQAIAKDGGTPEDKRVVATTAVKYLRLHGEGAGNLLDEPPVTLNLADYLKKGEKIEVYTNSVKAGKENYQFSTKPETRFDLLDNNAKTIEARRIWAHDPKGAKLADGMAINSSDLPLLEAAYTKQLKGIKLRANGGSLTAPLDQSALLNAIQVERQRIMEAVKKGKVIVDPNSFEEKLKQILIGDPKVEISDALKNRAKQPSTEELAKILNVRLGYLEGTAVDERNLINDLFAMQTDAREYTDMMIKTGRWSAGSGEIPTYLHPQTSKLIYDTTPIKDMDGNVVKGIAAIKVQQRLFQNQANNAVASVVGPDLYALLPTFAERQSSGASRLGIGNAGKLTAADAPYGSFGSMIQWLGNVTHKIKVAFEDSATTAMTPSLYGIGSDLKAAVEVEAMNTALRNTTESYYFDPARGEFGSMVLRRIKVNEELMETGQKPQLAEVRDVNAPKEIPFTTQKAADVWAAHVKQNGEWVSKNNLLAGANGYQPKLDPRVAYPIPVNQKRYPFFAYVVDPTFNETGHVHMIYGATEKDLDNLINDVKKNTNFEVTPKNTELKVLTKADTERFYKAQGDYSREDTISENYIRNELLRKGVSSNYVPATDPQKIADNFLQFHLEKARSLARYAVITKNSKEFAELKTMGESATALATSKVGGSSLVKWAENQVSNPFSDYTKTALDITNLNEVPRWTAVNNYLDKKASDMWSTVQGMWAKSTSQEDLDVINDTFKRFGLQTAHYDAATVAHANHVASDGAFTKFVARANGVMATLLLRMDPFNAANNVAGSVVLTGPEFASIRNAIKKGSVVGAGELSKLADITVPGTGDAILSPTKLFGNSIRAFFFDPAAREWATKTGFTTRHLMEVESLIDTAAMTGKETDEMLLRKGGDLYTKFMAMGEIGEKWTGNKLAEEFNRFTAAYTMKQVTDIAVEHGIMRPENALSYINTFVNRTQGNYLASQRPLMFSGPIGNAIGLFQTYQFNMAQQLLRHVAEGNAKDAALALGLQTAVYGMNGLPGFQQINAHLVGNASGNQDHRDLYDATYGGAGKQAGDWLMYGAASNALGFLHPDLKMNLYSRGDINPRQPTILPTSLSEVPIVGGFAKFYTSVKAGVDKMAQGANAWPTVLQTIEHSGINRPLAGLAQTLEALGNPTHQSYSTSNKGNVIAANDLFSFANLTRLGGAKPLDEAIAVDSGYRLDAYKIKDSQHRLQLGEAIKTAVLAGNNPSNDQMETFIDNYVKSGGDQDGFNKFYMGVMKRANTSQVNAIAENLKSPYHTSMQKILGGYELKDFSQ